MFLEIVPDSNSKQNVSSSLSKLYEKNIKQENIRGAFLNLKTTQEILITDLNSQEQYSLEKKQNLFNISDILKKNLNEKRNSMQLNIDADYCSKNCKANEYPFIKVMYSFNMPPEINLIAPEDGSIEKQKNISLIWEGKDSDGRFLEYMLEVSKDRFFQENIILKSEWLTQNRYNLVLEDGIYYWRIHSRDNSFLENTVTSETFDFEVQTKEEVVERIVLTKPIISKPQNGLVTNARQIEVVAKTQKDVKNYILLNNIVIKETDSDEINTLINLTKEGENTIKIISEKEKYSSESKVTIVTKWTPPSTPDFEFKIENGKVFVKIKNEDYEKAYIYFEDQLVKEIQKNNEWIEIGESLETEMKFGVMLEDDLGNQTDILYQTYSPHEEVLGIGGSSHNMPKTKIPNPSLCRYKYNRTYKKFQSRRCNITKPEIIKIENTTKDNKVYNTNIMGVYNPNMIILIDEYQCTWKIGCREKFLKTRRLNLSPYTAIMVYINNRFTSMNELRKGDKYFFTSYLVGNKNLASQKATLRYHINHGFKHDNHWVDLNFTSSSSTVKTIPKVTKLPNTQKIFRFPFKKNIGVTQWHGYTAYQSPHTGIDFGSYREPVYAIADGIIKEAKWDNYNGKCLSGGYFIRIEHKNGMNSVYLHLENFKKSNGKYWGVGQSIKKGEQIGISGNTGYYNCQTLGHHLHFEIRKDTKQQNHLNPVPYIDINWNNIPTLQHTKYPGRLTGNNPHPKW